MNKVIYIDFDDVLCETARVLAKTIEREFGKVVAYNDILHFDLAKTFDLNEKETEWLFEIFHNADVLSRIPIIDGAAEAIKAWHQHGMTIHIVTGRPPATHTASKQWLEKYNIPYHKLSFVDKFGRNHAHVDGVDILTLDDLKQLKFTVAIEDSPIAISFQIENTNNPVIIFDRPWNRNMGELEQSAQVYRCKTWKDVIEQVKTLTNDQDDA